MWLLENLTTNFLGFSISSIFFLETHQILLTFFGSFSTLFSPITMTDKYNSNHQSFIYPSRKCYHDHQKNSKNMKKCQDEHKKRSCGKSRKSINHKIDEEIEDCIRKNEPLSFAIIRRRIYDKYKITVLESSIENRCMQFYKSEYDTMYILISSFHIIRHVRDKEREALLRFLIVFLNIFGDYTSTIVSFIYNVCILPFIFIHS